MFDSLLLVVRVVRRRARACGVPACFVLRALPPSMPLLYLDLGTHRAGRELEFMAVDVLPRISDSFVAIGFEANSESCAAATARLGNLPRVRIVHCALVDELPPGGAIRLFKAANEGIGDSLYRTGPQSEDVAALRLSDFLVDNHLDPIMTPTILRMNIEGAEFDVLRDLDRRDLLRHVDGFYGMWDDLSKIDGAADDSFRSFIREHGIHTLTFNGRDMNWALRRWCIRYDIRTALRVGANRKRPNLRHPPPP
jgi:FkbM family methyltransferase